MCSPSEGFSLRGLDLDARLVSVQGKGLGISKITWFRAWVGLQGLGNMFVIDAVALLGSGCHGQRERARLFPPGRDF